MEERRKIIDEAPDLLTQSREGDYSSVHVKLKTLSKDFKAPEATKQSDAHMIEVGGLGGQGGAWRGKVGHPRVWKCHALLALSLLPQVSLNDRLGKKVRVKCNSNDTVMTVRPPPPPAPAP